MSDELRIRKIQPRNLTAHADHWVRGNPATTRPESGVDNCYPGLEFDQRNLDKRFFPGLEFEFHASGFPPLLRSVDVAKAGRPLPIQLGDIGDNIAGAFFLWAVFGKLGAASGPATTVVRFDGTHALQSWRLLHDLEPGPVAILLARRREPEGGINLSATEQLEAETALQGGGDLVRRDAQGNLVFAVLSGSRASYLVDGVINPALYEPGDLTRSLCAPWQYDFTDCGCFYWASNKPDLVAVDPNGPQIYNFQRHLRNGSERSPEEVLADRIGLLTIYNPRDNPGGWDSRVAENPNRIMVHHEVMNRWESLFAVINNAEVSRFVPQPPVQLPAAEVLARNEILRRLRYLATVEHGLMVEYLYAYYSVNAGRLPPEGEGEASSRYEIARSVLSVAIDEMRHFRWVNEILRELNQVPELGRVDEFQDLDQDTRFIAHTFQLAPLTLAQLDWFIEVEKPSADVDPDRAQDTIDGLYTRILLSIRQSAEFTDIERAKLVHLIKLIVDEGFDHYTRFRSVRRLAEGLQEPLLVRDDYAVDPPALPDGHPAKVAEIVADRAYSTVLSTLDVVFRTSDNRTRDMLQAARFAMYALDEAARECQTLGGYVRFTLPAASLVQVAGFAEPEIRISGRVERIVERMMPELAKLRESGSEAAAASMERHYQRLREEMARLE